MNSTKDQIKHSTATDGKLPVMCCGLTEVEFTERELLLELQRSGTRWFSQREFDRLKELSGKMFANAGSPHSTQRGGLCVRWLLKPQMLN